MTVPCTATADTAIGSTCSITTTADIGLPGTVIEIKRTIWQLGPVRGLRRRAGRTGGHHRGNTLFAVQGVYVP